MTPDAAALLLALLLGHFLGDFTPLLTERMREAKERGGPMGPMVDAMIRPPMAAAAEDLANRIIGHLERTHG